MKEDIVLRFIYLSQEAEEGSVPEDQGSNTPHPKTRQRPSTILKTYNNEKNNENLSFNCKDPSMLSLKHQIIHT